MLHTPLPVVSVDVQAQVPHSGVCAFSPSGAAPTHKHTTIGSAIVDDWELVPRSRRPASDAPNARAQATQARESPSFPRPCPLRRILVAGQPTQLVDLSQRPIHL